jgi:hypothetical protein
MNIKDKLVWILLPSLVLIIIGILAISFPEFFKHEGGYAGYGGKSGLLVFIYRLFLYVFWGKLMGFLSAFAGVIGLVYFAKEIFKKEQIVPVDVAIKQEVTTLALSKAFDFSKKRFKRSRIKGND